MTGFIPLTSDEKDELLQTARRSIELAVSHRPLPEIVLTDYSSTLQALGASFVTLTKAGDLRGCIGTIEAYQPLVQDVCEHAVCAALSDYRFYPVRPEDVPQLKIEISRLSSLSPVPYDQPDELLLLIQPCVDGVVFMDGVNRATFLPQVWEKIDTTEEFLGCLAQKLGAPPDYWRRKKFAVYTYRVEKISE
jgi:AmmeMemoRadiSam system protein A